MHCLIVCFCIKGSNEKYFNINVINRDGPDIRKISDIRHIRLIFQYPKYRRISGAKPPDIRLIFRISGSILHTIFQRQKFITDYTIEILENFCSIICYEFLMLKMVCNIEPDIRQINRISGGFAPDIRRYFGY